jgi:5S rRNA maturation endonuclease (ribonuclease M5)
LIATYERIFERLLLVLERLGSKATLGVFIIVEGKKDSLALLKLGIVGSTIQVKGSGRVLEDCLELDFGNEVVVLVDFDEHGTELAKEIVKILEPRKIKIDLKIWKEIRALVRKDIKDIEGLPSYFERLKKKVQN